MNQQRMFETEDLPLFSGTAPKGEAETFDPQTENQQESLAKCPLCLDTGKLGERVFCWCEAGQKARRAQLTPAAMEAARQLVEGSEGEWLLRDFRDRHGRPDHPPGEPLGTKGGKPMNKYPPSSNPWRDPPVRCVDCRFYPDDCGYWKPHKNANTVKPECWHGCPDYEPRETLGTDEREESPNA